MKVIVTGASGHVGGAVRACFESNGHEVIPVSRHAGLREDITSEGFPQRLVGLLGSCEVVVHCSAHITKSLCDRDVSIVNALGTQQVIEAARLLGAVRLVYISSLPVIGTPVVLPVDEDHSVNPPTAYHASKLYGEHLMRLTAAAGLSTASLRLTSPVGPGTPRGRIFSEFVYRAKQGLPLVLAGAGGRRQNYVDVRDVAEAVLRCARSDASGIYNIAGPVAVSNLELAETCVRVLDSNSNITFSGSVDVEERMSWDVSIQKAGISFGYNPSFSIAASICDAARE